MNDTAGGSRQNMDESDVHAEVVHTSFEILKVKGEL